MNPGVHVHGLDKGLKPESAAVLIQGDDLEVIERKQLSQALLAPSYQGRGANLRVACLGVVIRRTARSTASV